jgi:hypothetical protein
MKTHMGNSGLWLGAMTMVLGSVVSIQAASTASSSNTVVDSSKRAARLLRQIKADALAVRSAAAQLDSLTEGSGARWLDYDLQWNEIKPSVEDMQMKLARLETMQSALSPAERTDLNQIKPLIGEVQSRTHQFITLLDAPGVQTSGAKFKTYARSLRGEADKREKRTPAI